MANTSIIRIGVIGCGEIARQLIELVSVPHSINSEPPHRVTRQIASYVKPLVKKGLEDPLGSVRRLSKRILNDRGGRKNRIEDDKRIGSVEVKRIDGVEVVAVADIDEARLKEFSSRFAVPHSYLDYRQVLSRDDIDAVLICTPPFLHAEITIEAARSKKHVYCEKPMAITSSECQTMIEAAAEAGVMLQIGYVLRFSSERTQLRESIIEGELGRPVFWREIYNPRGGPLQRWVHNDATGGGVLWENSHTFDFLRYTFGEPEAVVGVGLQCKPETTKAIDTFAVLLSFPKGDKALFTDSYGLAGFGWDITACRGHHLQIDVLGAHGWAQFPDRNYTDVLTICHRKENKEVVRKVPWTSEWGANGYVNELEHFFESVRTGQTSRHSGYEAMKTIRLCEIALQSIRTGKIWSGEQWSPT